MNQRYATFGDTDEPAVPIQMAAMRERVLALENTVDELSGRLSDIEDTEAPETESVPLDGQQQARLAIGILQRYAALILPENDGAGLATITLLEIVESRLGLST